MAKARPPDEHIEPDELPPTLAQYREMFGWDDEATMMMNESCAMCAAKDDYYGNHPAEEMFLLPEGMMACLKHIPDVYLPETEGDDGGA